MAKWGKGFGPRIQNTISNQGQKKFGIYNYKAEVIHKKLNSYEES